MNRPFLHLRIDDLETRFAEGPNDYELLRQLQAELRFRSTPRATRLASKVTERVNKLYESMLGGNRPSEAPDSTSDQLPQLPIPSGVIPNSRATVPEGRSEEANPIDFGKAAVSEMPIKNTPEGLLSAWIAQEVLAPQTFSRPEDLASGDKSRVALMNDGVLPWARGERSRPKYQLYYQVVLGTLKMQPTVESLLRRFGDSRPDYPSGKKSVALAFVVLDRTGRMVEAPAVGVSSFAWGVMRALKSDLADLAGWQKFEPEIIRRLEQCLLGNPRDDDEANRARERPLTNQLIAQAFRKLILDLDLPPSWVEAPSFAIRSYCYFKDPNPPEPILLNSFFLNDLTLARDLHSRGKLPPNLQRYLGLQRPSRRHDLLQDADSLEQAVRPTNTPAARWPGKERHPLVLLQQAAVNLAFEQTNQGGLLGINGPPGTGKTTLLRDIVAGVVASRAEAMCCFDDPETAFSNSTHRLRVGEGGWLHLYRVDASLKGFELIVASSNNKAVENVSAELPGMGAIAQDAEGLRYLKTLSDSLHGNNTWGAVAAVLGNAQNRHRFKQTFWWDDDVGLNSYLRAAAGSPVLIDDQDEGAPQRVPRIIENERPATSHKDAIRQWDAARQRFKTALTQSRQHQLWLEGLRKDLFARAGLQAAASAARTRRDRAVGVAAQGEASFSRAYAEHVAVQIADQGAREAVKDHNALRPGFWSRFFRTRAARAWTSRLKDLTDKVTAVGKKLKNAAAHASSAKLGFEVSVRERDLSESALITSEDDLTQCEKRLLDAREQHGVVFPDQKFFEQPSGSLHLATPWFSSNSQRLRDEVFIAAMAVHRAFLDAAAKPLRHNLSALMNVFTSQTLPSPEKQELLTDLWASLFLVVPLVSTTFASVHRMLGKLPIESLGWLLVDEAGQAAPQAVVGALLRTRKAVVVGDPIQIQPVVTLPSVLVQSICRRFGVAPDVYSAPDASVQTLADAASAYTTEFPTRTGSRSVGVPLLVHRRCSDPMFKVANAIAYAGLMVSAKTSRPSRIRDVLGPSSWIDVVGDGQDKWCEEEGRAVLSLLDRLKRSQVPPNLYVVSPFVIVADRLRQMLNASGQMDSWVDGESRQWVYERVGTVHTVQGREAEAIILVLGAPAAGQNGARNWAGSPPNLLNVSVTRAQEALYVIGNRQHWREAGCFSQLDRMMP